MYNFILNMWVMRKIDEEKVYSYVSKKYITDEEANMIIATPQGWLDPKVAGEENAKASSDGIPKD